MTNQSTAISSFESQFPAVAQRGIDESTWHALQDSVYPGAKTESILMAIDYCKARGLDILLKPVHLVGMSVKNAQTNKSEWRDVVMPGIGLYRIQADRSGTYAGADEPEFGPVIQDQLPNESGVIVDVRYPEWCKYTVYKMIGGQRVAFSAKEYWLENYAVNKRDSQAPNAMWKKRPFAQLAKCAEAQALRKAWPEIGQEPTAEEMEGKEFFSSEKDVTPQAQKTTQPAALAEYPAAQFEVNFTKWATAIESGKRTAAQIIAMVESKGSLTEAQKAAIHNCEAIEGEIA